MTEKKSKSNCLSEELKSNLNHKSRQRNLWTQMKLQFSSPDKNNPNFMLIQC